MDVVTTGNYFATIAELRNEWPVQGPQAAAVLDLIDTLPEAVLLGAVTDRRGRSGIAIAIATATRWGGTFRDILVFDPETGALTSSEVVYLGGHPEIDIPDDTVMSYAAWR